MKWVDLKDAYQVGDFLRENIPFAPLLRVIRVAPRSVGVVVSSLDGKLCLSGPKKIGKGTLGRYYSKLSQEDVAALRQVAA